MEEGERTGAANGDTAKKLEMLQKKLALLKEMAEITPPSEIKAVEAQIKELQESTSGAAISLAVKKEIKGQAGADQARPGREKR